MGNDMNRFPEDDGTEPEGWMPMEEIFYPSHTKAELACLFGWVMMTDRLACCH